MVLNIKCLKFNPKYFICDKGFIISTVRGINILYPRKDKNGYTRCYIRDINDGKRKDYKLHRLVAEYFIDNPNNYKIVNHIDGNKSNNHIDNLEWCTYSENNIHAYKTGLTHSKKCPILCTTNNKVYSSQLEASKELNISRASILSILNNKVYSVKGLHFEYINKNWKFKNN